MAERGALERAHVRIELLRHLAAGGRTKTQLAKLYGVTQQAVSQFAERHAAEITDLKTKLDDEWAGLWIASKRARLAELEAQVDRVIALVSDPDEALRANVGLAEVERVAQTALRNAAEELGQLPSRTTVQHEGSVSVRYVIEGVDMDTLS